VDDLHLADWRRRVAEMYARWRVESAADPETATAHLRASRDRLFRDHPMSPLPIDERARFDGLAYFDYDPAYRFTAVLEPESTGPSADRPAASPLAIRLPSSGGEAFSFRRIGHVRLAGPLAGAMLPVFWMEGYAGGLFLPFRDATTGRETYGAGRYLLDTVKGADLGTGGASGELLLDFNLAYHPSCAHDPRWNCPLAPPESRLEQRVTAGERLR
jgi:uncharacterized protein (DUF1684 family)